MTSAFLALLLSVAARAAVATPTTPAAIPTPPDTLTAEIAAADTEFSRSS